MAATALSVGRMGTPVESVTLEILEAGVAEESRRLGPGRFVLGENPRVELTVGAGGCWVEGPTGLLQVNGAPRQRVELSWGDVISFGEHSIRVWPSPEPLMPRTKLKLSSKQPEPLGLAVELWWQGQRVHYWRTWRDEVRLPASLLAIEGYEPGKTVAMREGDSYRFFVPSGCEASEPLQGREAVVPRWRALVIERRGLRLKVSLASAKRVHPLLKVAFSAASVMAILAVVIGCDLADGQYHSDLAPFQQLQRGARYVTPGPRPRPRPQLRPKAHDSTIWSYGGQVMVPHHENLSALLQAASLGRGPEVMSCREGLGPPAAGTSRRLEWSKSSAPLTIWCDGGRSR